MAYNQANARMAKSLKAFKAGLDKYKKVSGLSIEGTINELTMFIYREIVEGTPRDTGRARMSWIADKMQTKRTNYLPAEKKRAKKGQTQERYSEAEIELHIRSELGKFEKADLERMQKEVKNVIYTNLVYMPRLNDDGHSKQNQKFVEQAIDKATQRMQMMIDRAVKDAQKRVK